MHGARQPDEHTPDATDEASSRFRALARRKRSELEDLVRRGGSVRPAEVAGGLYRGWNMASLASLLRVRKFFKRFHRPADAKAGTAGEEGEESFRADDANTPGTPDDANTPGTPGGAVAGENILARQSGLAEPWRPRFGGRGWLPFLALPPGSGEGGILPRALVISYRAWPGRGALHPVGRVTDYLVRPDRDRPDLLLGASYATAAGRRFLLEHFLLERTGDA